MAEEGTENYMNAVEPWPIYDHVQIRSDIPVDSNKGYPSYAAIPTRVPFFNVRTEGEVGSAMTNLESKDSLAYGFRLYNLGVFFRAPVGDLAPAVFPVAGGILGANNPNFPAIFNGDVPARVAVRFQVRQDDKLLSNCYMTPAGIGPYGNETGTVAAAPPGFAVPAAWARATQGDPELGNRWNFVAPGQDPIIMPRGCTFRAILEFDDYIKGLLAIVPGPGELKFCTDGLTEKSFPACALIGVSLFGLREVQQRSALHV